MDGLSLTLSDLFLPNLVGGDIFGRRKGAAYSRGTEAGGHRRLG